MKRIIADGARFRFTPDYLAAMGGPIEGQTMTREDRNEAARLKAAAPPAPTRGDKADPRRPAWNAWRDECWKAAKARAPTVDMSTFLEACGSPD